MRAVESSPKPTILVVEDDELLCDSTSRPLESLGYKALCARDGPHALSLLEEDEKVDVLLSDVVMPGGMIGEALAEEVERLDAKIKVLLTSGYPREDLVAQGRLAGQLPLLNKPFRRAQLKKSVQDLPIKAGIALGSYSCYHSQ